jgi:peptide/nickel transport system substrate-binding protein
MAAPPAEVEVNPGKLVIMMGDLGNERFDRTLSSGIGINYGRILHGYLISENEKRQMMPGIATAWDLSPDGLTWSFTIREGVKFHDGSDVTPEDVRWTLEQSFGPKAVDYSKDSSGIRTARLTDRIELSGPDKVILIAKEPSLELAILVSEPGVKWYGVMPQRDTVGDTPEAVAYDNNPIAAGPMRLSNHVRASVMSFERFDDFYFQPDNGLPEDRRVNFQSLDLFLVPEEATRVAALRAGEADIVPASLATKQQVEAGGGRLIFGQEGGVVDIRLVGCYEPQYPCHDKRVRQALDYAINKELIRDQLYGGPEVFQITGWTVVTPSTMGYTPEMDPRPFDPEKARQLLEEAGYPGGQGFGKLIVNTYPSQSMPLQVEAAQLGAEFWRRELGLDVEVRVAEEFGVSEREDAGELNGQITWRSNDARTDATSKLSADYSDPESYDRLHENPELFQVVQEAFQILDPDERVEASAKLFPRLREESYQIGIGYANIPWGLGPRVLTWEPYPLSLHPSALHTITLE